MASFSVSECYNNCRRAERGILRHSVIGALALPNCFTDQQSMKNKQNQATFLHNQLFIDEGTGKE